MLELNYKEGKVPDFWRTTLGDIDEAVKTVKKGKITVSKSAGGRDIFLIEYGERNKFSHMANLSSAAGSGDVSCYADKSDPAARPTLLLAGAMHGAEFEGTSAILNLIKIIETGTDYAENRHEEFDGITEKINLLLIPCLNPDGRARVPFKTVCGMSFEEFRYWAQGTWKDGSLAGWPECKKIHPILDYADHLGAYYNDDGINLMHDDFFAPMAKETEFLLNVAGEFIPDATILLHGGTNSPNMLLSPECVPFYFKQEVQNIALDLQRRCFENGLRGSNVNPLDLSDGGDLVKMNAVTAVTLKCGELCATYETNQGLAYGKLILDYEEIYRHHMLLFAQMSDYIQNLKERRVSVSK